MGTYNVFSPEWLEENLRLYNENAELQDALRNLTVKMGYRTKADPEWGIEEDILWCTFFEKGKLNKMCVMTQEEMDNESDFVLGATPEIWCKLIRRTAKFGTQLTLGKVKVEQGSKIGVMKVAPYSKHVVTLLTQAETVFPIELS